MTVKAIALHTAEVVEILRGQNIEKLLNITGTIMEYDGAWCLFKNKKHYRWGATLNNNIMDACPYQKQENVWIKELWRTEKRWDNLTPSEIVAVDREAVIWLGNDCLLKSDDYPTGKGKIRSANSMPIFFARSERLRVIDIDIVRIDDIWKWKITLRR